MFYCVQKMNIFSSNISNNGNNFQVNSSSGAAGGIGTIKKTPNSNNIQPQVKKLVIKNLKDTSKASENYQVESWSHLSNAIDSIYKKQPIKQTLEELYRMVDNLCSTEKYATTLTYVVSKHTKSIWDIGLHYFKTFLLSSTNLDKKLRIGILINIEKERNGETIDKDLLHHLIQMLLSLQIYESFEKELLSETSMFYYKESNHLINEYETPEYLKHVNNRIAEENTRSLRYIDPSTKRAIIQVVEKQMLEQHLDRLLQKGFNQMVEMDKIEDLELLYSLFTRVNGLSKLKSAWGQYIKTAGASMLADTEKDSSMIEDLIIFKDRMDHILNISFSKNDQLNYSFKESFEHFINTRQNKPAELIAKFIDSKLRSGSKGISDDELEMVLNKALALFRFIQGKDVFEAFYKTDLSKRLLMDKSMSIDVEKSVVLKLRNECGTVFTAKLEGMFNDIELSNEIMASFKECMAYTEHIKNIEMNVFVLASSNWPQYTPLNANLPTQFLEYQEMYRKFYSSKYPNRKLIWQNSLGQCVLKCFFQNGKKDTISSLLQTVVLLLFNNLNQDEEITLGKIQELSGIELEELKRHMMPLINSNTRILSRRSKNKSKILEIDDLFSFNKDFTHKLTRLKVNALQAKETVEENKKTNEAIIHDRQYQIDAAIVRIMKARKTLTHNLLMSELFQQLRFTPKPVDLKKRIESLIEREYLGRDQNNPMSYHYLA
ncbi:cullin [Cavenderia fasciculata]|uniref:Cullin-4 n=1 Tax=Cavenderia fasciculata TaxID=261658 RepID=F4PRC5_CACFS|nr:cullin [Cavenderia fasciculata]EGG20477.1 cullin [Cavenderia fasciculata]|eukprot:XP_004358327.1 cullin [Cavenderia fasciculata]